ncbi:MAG: Rrf2 family transcriptional regulator [Sphingobacteriales bacterium]|nr:Rrf2 family transcriptional regulator [Sphingobacteriales bacterium]
MFSKTTEYALRAVIYIAQKSSAENKLGLEEIAKAIHSPKSFTAKILQQLTARNKIVSSARGPNGGFFITDKSKQQPVKSVLEVMGEDVKLEKCVLGLKQCSELKPCPMHSEYKLIKPQLIHLFEKKTIQNLADEISNGIAFIKN